LKTLWKASYIQDMDISIKFKETFKDFLRRKPIVLGMKGLASHVKTM